jgi:hypothetical protein
MPELGIIEGNQQVAIKRDESLSPSLFTFRSYFAAIHHDWYYEFMTARFKATDPLRDILMRSGHTLLRSCEVIACLSS